MRAESKSCLNCVVFCVVTRCSRILSFERESAHFILTNVFTRWRWYRAGDLTPSKNILLGLEVSVDIQVFRGDLLDSWNRDFRQITLADLREIILTAFCIEIYFVECTCF
jgi:hypothetical protein